MSNTTPAATALAKRPRAPRKPSIMSAAEADRFAQQAGLVNVRASSLAGSAGLGDYVSQLGALSIARSIYVFTASEIQAILGQADRVLETNPAPEIKGSVIASKEKLIVSLLNTARGLADSCKLDMAAPAPPEPLRSPAFGPGAVVQVNIGPPQPPAPPPVELPATSPDVDIPVNEA